MKTKIFLIFPIFLFLSTFVSAQIIVQNNAVPKRKIERGMQISKDAVVALFGNPVTFRQQYDDVVYNADYKIFEYQGLNFSTVGDVVHDFEVSSNLYLVSVYGYVFKVGNLIESIKNMIPANDVMVKTSDKMTEFRFKIPGTNLFPDETLLVETDSGGIIRNIQWCIPD